MDYLVRKTLAPAAYTIANAGGTHANTRGFNSPNHALFTTQSGLALHYAAHPLDGQPLDFNAQRLWRDLCSVFMH